jgi:hypothetical protein
MNFKLEFVGDITQAQKVITLACDHLTRLPFQHLLRELLRYHSVHSMRFLAI